jgi:5'-nucleotidase
MSMMQYDLSTIGNHDFDNGVQGLYAQMPHAKFEFVSANYDFKIQSWTDWLNHSRFSTKNGIKVGVLE